MSFGNGNTLMNGEFMGFVVDDASIVALRGWAERQGHPAATVQQGGPDMFAQMLESATPPRLAVVDVDGQSDPVSTAARLAGMCGRECRLVIIGSVNDVALYRRIVGAGAADYLVKPLTAEQINQSLAAALRGPSAAQPTVKESRIVTVIGARGGVGASTIALNLGWIMAHELGLTAALLDLDLQFGTSALALDLEPGRGLRDIVGSPQRVDNLMITSSMVAESENFSVLGAEEAVDEIIHMDGGAITALLKEMKSSVDVMIIDMPRHMIAAQKRAVMAAHEIVIVSDMSLTGIRDTLRIKNALIGLGCPATITLVTARTNAAGVGQIDRAVFEKGVQAKIDASIAEDSTAFTAASNSGKALAETAPRASVTKVLRELAGRLAKVEQPATGKTSLLGKFFGGRKMAKQAAS